MEQDDYNMDETCEDSRCDECEDRGRCQVYAENETITEDDVHGDGKY